MTTLTDLRRELDRRADLAPSDDEIRRALTERITRHARRRRTTALVAAAAAVVVVAGGAGIAGAVLSHRSAGPAGPTPVVSVPDVPLPQDTKLIRHQLQAVTTPVMAIPPKGLTGKVWMSSPSELAVGWFDPSAESASPSSVGYTVTDSRMGRLTGYADPDDPQASGLSHQEITVGGHPATLDIAPEGTLDGFGLPASERISWRLADGRWIHVWSSGPQRQSSPSATLREFANGIAETPQTLQRSVGIGLTLPGLTVDSSINSSPLASVLGANLFLCRAGVDPLVASSGSSSGSGSSPAPTSASIAPGQSGPTSTQTQTEDDPSAQCVTAAVMNYPGAKLNSGSGSISTVTVGDTVAHVDAAKGAAWADLGEGLTAVVGAPASAHLSAADLAALVASVRLSPAVTVLPLQLPQGTAQGTGGALSASAVPSSAIPSSSAAVTQSTSATDRPASMLNVTVPNVRGMSAQRATQELLDNDLEYKVVEVNSSSVVDGRVVGQIPGPGEQVPAHTRIEIQVAQSAESIADSAAAATVLTQYLVALAAGDCSTADTFTASSFVVGNGELCGAVQVSTYSAPERLTSLKPGERDFEVTMTTGGSADGSIPPGSLTWFYVLQQQPAGGWLITGGGSGI